MGEFSQNSIPYVPTHQLCFVADMNFTLAGNLLPRALELILCSHGSSILLPQPLVLGSSHTPLTLFFTSLLLFLCFPGALFSGSGPHLPPVAAFGLFHVLILNCPFAHGFSLNLQLHSALNFGSLLQLLLQPCSLEEGNCSSPGPRWPSYSQAVK